MDRLKDLDLSRNIDKSLNMMNNFVMSRTGEIFDFDQQSFLLRYLVIVESDDNHSTCWYDIGYYSYDGVPMETYVYTDVITDEIRTYDCDNPYIRL